MTPVRERYLCLARCPEVSLKSLSEFAEPLLNASNYVTRLDKREPVARTIRAIFTATDILEVNDKLKAAVKKWQAVHPMLAKWAEHNLAEGFTGFGLPEPHRLRMRTTKGLEWLNKETKQRTRVACLLPNPELTAPSQRALVRAR